MSVYEDVKRKLDELYNMITPDNVNSWVEDLDKVVDIFTKGEYLKNFMTALEYTCDRLKQDDKKATKIRKIIHKLVSKEPDFLLERLTREGRRLLEGKGENGLRDAFDKQILRILEQTRLGKRDSVVGMIQRIFIAQKEDFPTELIDALKPSYDDNLFKAFIYAFLSGFKPTKSQSSEEKEVE